MAATDNDSNRSVPVKERPTAIALPKGRVTELGSKWYVQQQNLDRTWTTFGKEYQHRTSALAALGRMYMEASEGTE